MYNYALYVYKYLCVCVISAHVFTFVKRSKTSAFLGVITVNNGLRPKF